MIKRGFNIFHVQMFDFEPFGFGTVSIMSDSVLFARLAG
jgi:hypothetical protein